jgi:protein O-GlcNAc transferase
MKSPANVTHLFTAAQRYHQSGQLQRAADLYRQILAQAPYHADTLHLLGLICSRQQRYPEAVKYLRRALQQQPENPIFHNNLGEVLRRQGRLDPAVNSYRQALALNPQFAEAHYNLANVYRLQGHADEAAVHYQRALVLRPDYLKAYYNLGNTLFGQRQFAAATACYRQAIALNPQYVEAHLNLGRAEEQLGRLEVTRQSLQQVLALEPDDQLLRLHLATLCPPIPAGNAAIDAYRADLHATLTRYAEYDLQFTLPQLQRSGALPPYNLMYQGRDDRRIKEMWAGLFQGHFPEQRAKPGRGRPHIGVVITAGHAGGFLKSTRGLFNQLPPERFRLTIVCSPQDARSISPHMSHPTVRYLELSDQLEPAVAQLRQARFDLLYYREVGSDLLNYVLPFFRPAPVQCLSFGTPVTTGIPQMDYYLSAEQLETPESDAHYTETLVRFRHLPLYYERPTLPANPRPRDYFGLPANRRLYLCLQNLRKIHPDADPLPAAILRRDPQGLLVFIADEAAAITDLLRQRFQAGMPDLLERIYFLPRMGRDDYLSLLLQGDVILDMPHYSGVNTMYDAFAAGKPVVTLPTRYLRGRFTAAAYRTMGMDDCIAATPAAYVDLALQLGTDPSYRATISRRISEAGPVLFENVAAVTELTDFFDMALARARQA